MKSCALWSSGVVLTQSSCLTEWDATPADLNYLNQAHAFLGLCCSAANLQFVATAISSPLKFENHEYSVQEPPKWKIIEVVIIQLCRKTTLVGSGPTLTNAEGSKVTSTGKLHMKMRWWRGEESYRKDVEKSAIWESEQKREEASWCKKGRKREGTEVEGNKKKKKKKLTTKQAEDEEELSIMESSLHQAAGRARQKKMIGIGRQPEGVMEALLGDAL